VKRKPSATKDPTRLLEQDLYPYCLVQVGSRNRFDRDFTIELKEKKKLS